MRPPIANSQFLTDLAGCLMSFFTDYAASVTRTSEPMRPVRKR